LAKWKNFRFAQPAKMEAEVIQVTLVCTYFGMWEVTKTYGYRGLEPLANIEGGRLPLLYECSHQFSSPAPFVVIRDETIRVGWPIPHSEVYRDSYLWLCGLTFKLPN
jgi:hypothetical protein